MLSGSLEACCFTARGGGNLIGIEERIETAGRVLIVQADTDAAEVLRSQFELEQFAVSVAGDDDAAIQDFDGRVDVVVLQLSPLVATICRRIRRYSDAWLIAIADPGSEAAVAQGFDAGLDDVVVGPVRPEVLMARIRARLRRSSTSRDGHSARHFGDLTISLARAEAQVDGRTVPLTRTELRLLTLLAGNPTRVYSRREIMEHLWASTHVGDQHACEVHVSNLRRKIEEDPARPKRLLTVRGQGYVFVPHVASKVQAWTSASTS